MFFIEWGKKANQYVFKGLEIEGKCPECKKKLKVNLYYNSEATEIYWISGRGSITTRQQATGSTPVLQQANREPRGRPREP